MSLVIPILLAIVVWWAGTGIVLYVQQRLQAPGKALVCTLGSLTALSLVLLSITSTSHGMVQSYGAFVAAVVLWGCLELSYYTGLLTGVHKRACPQQCTSWRRFRLALGTSIWHELSVLLFGVTLFVMLFEASNPTGLYTFLVLWFMRWSAKLNLFFGVPNFNTDWFPKNMAYAHSYIRRSAVTLFYPVSILLASLAAYHFLNLSLNGTEINGTGLNGSELNGSELNNSDKALSTLLPGVLLLLAILEHIFLALPIADSALWNRIFVAADSEAPTGPEMSVGTDAGSAEEHTLASVHTAPGGIVNGSTKPQVSVTLVTVDSTTSTVTR